MNRTSTRRRERMGSKKEKREEGRLKGLHEFIKDEEGMGTVEDSASRFGGTGI